MDLLAISVENLTKEYRLGVINHGTLRQDMESWWARVRGKEDPNALVTSTNRSREGRFLALEDVSFSVGIGEVIGVIGGNGAGKSTLLKILSRITAPSSGRARVNGRIASLLEVGTGFHPELTGRENIFLNGAILGMSKSEISRKMDEIIVFAEIEKFIDTPVKRYSSGMYVRLAFAVAAHLEPEILLVDEVLAVGDAAFQKKCLGKMAEVGREGRTILFVSHNMGAILTLCSRAILLEGGKKVAEGEVAEVVNGYLAKTSEQRIVTYRCQTPPNNRAWIEEACLLNPDGESAERLLMTSPLKVECEMKVNVTSRYTLSVQVKEINGSPIFHYPNGDANFTVPEQPGKYRITTLLPPLRLYPGPYLLKLALCESSGQHYEHLHIVESLGFESEQDYGLCTRPLGRHAGVVFDQAEWYCESVLEENVLQSNKDQL